MSSDVAPFTLICGDDSIDVSLPTEELTFHSLLGTCLSSFGIPLSASPDLELQYKDEEGDLVTVTTDVEVAEAVNVFTSGLVSRIRVHVQGGERFSDRRAALLSRYKEAAHALDVEIEECVNALGSMTLPRTSSVGKRVGDVDEASSRLAHLRSRVNPIVLALIDLARLGERLRLSSSSFSRHHQSSSMPSDNDDDDDDDDDIHREVELFQQRIWTFKCDVLRATSEIDVLRTHSTIDDDAPSHSYSSPHPFPAHPSEVEGALATLDAWNRVSKDDRAHAIQSSWSPALVRALSSAPIPSEQ